MSVWIFSNFPATFNIQVINRPSPIEIIFIDNTIFKFTQIQTKKKHVHKNQNIKCWITKIFDVTILTECWRQIQIVLPKKIAKTQIQFNSLIKALLTGIYHKKTPNCNHL